MVKFQVELVDLIYPVGSIYISTNNTNPSLLFGGNWQQIKDKFLLSCGDTYNNGATGGASTVNLTKAQMPRHTHTQNSHSHSVGTTATGVNFLGSKDDIKISSTARAWASQVSSGGTHYVYHEYNKTPNGIGGYDSTNSVTATNQYTGGTNTTQAEQDGSAHENMPPYLAVYVWERIEDEEEE